MFTGIIVSSVVGGVGILGVIVGFIFYRVTAPSSIAPSVGGQGRVEGVRPVIENSPAMTSQNRLV